jgi:quinol monooxygenase YgiN
MIDFLTLVKRDHHDLECELDELLRAQTACQLRTALDGVRLGLTAHAEAEDIVLAVAIQNAPHRDQLETLIGQTRQAHLAQEGALSYVVSTTPETERWRQRARDLRELVRDHASYEEAHVIPAIAELAPEIYPRLAGQFATERLRQLAMLQPSAPIYVSELALAV